MHDIHLLRLLHHLLLAQLLLGLLVSINEVLVHSGLLCQFSVIDLNELPLLLQVLLEGELLLLGGVHGLRIIGMHKVDLVRIANGALLPFEAATLLLGATLAIDIDKSIILTEGFVGVGMGSTLEVGLLVSVELHVSYLVLTLT